MYLIFSFNVSNPERFAPYGQAVTPVILRHHGEVLTADFHGKVLEGTGHQVNAVLRFPSQDDADAFYHDPEYAPLKHLRVSSTTDATVTLVNHFIPHR